MNKKIISYLLCISILFTVFFIVSEKQVYADNSNVMTLEEAIKLINDRVNSKKKTKFSTINEPYTQYYQEQKSGKVLNPKMK